MAYIPPLNGGRINATISGNTAGAGSLVSTGTLTLAGGNNITLSQAGNAITISGGAGGGSNTFGMSNLGNTSGTTGVVSGGAFNYLLAGGNNVTLSQSLNGVSGTLTISAANQTVQTQSNIQGIIASGSTNTTGNISFANSNGVTFGLSNNTVTASVAAGGGLALSNSQTMYTSGTAKLLEGGGAITINSGTGQAFNFSVPQTSSLSATGAFSISNNGGTISMGVPAFSVGMNTLGNTAGTTGTVSNQLILAGGNNIVLSQATGAGGNSITISGSNQSNQTISFSAGSQSTLTAAGTMDARSFMLNGVGAASVGFSGSSAFVSVPTQSNVTASFTAASGATGNSTVNSTGSYDVRSMRMAGLGNVSVGFSNSSIVVSASQSAQTQSNIQGIIASGSTNTTGNISFANSNGVTFGLSNNTVTASFSGGGGAGGVAFSNSQTSYSSGTVQLLEAAGAAITIASTTGQKFNISVPGTSSLSATGALSVSTNGATISMGVPAFSAGVSNLGTNDSGNTGIQTNRVVFAGGSNISLSQATNASGATITINGASGGTGGGGGGVAISAGGALYSSGTMSLNGSGAITIASTTGTALNLSVPATSSIVGTNGISLVTAGGTVSIDGSALSNAIPAIPTLSRWEYPEDVFEPLATVPQAELSIQHMYIPFNITGSAAKIGGSLAVGTGTSATTGRVSVSLWMGIYTLTGSTLSLASSGSANNSFSVNNTGATSNNTSITGMRQFTVPMNVNMTPGEYWMAAAMSTATNFASNSMAFTIYGNSAYPTASGTGAPALMPIGSSLNAAQDALLFEGVYSAAVSAGPSSMSGGHINNTSASNVMRANFYNVIYNATY